MIVLIVVFYFMLAIFALWLLMFPDERDRLFAYVGGWLHRGRAGAAGLGRKSQSGARAGVAATRSGLVKGRTMMFRHRLALLAVVLLLTFPALVAMHMQGLFDFDVFERGERDSNELVSALLTGERLSPPAPLPPEVFTTREVEQVRPGLSTANREWGQLKQDFRQRLLAVFRQMEQKHGYQMVMIEGYRSPERQNRLANKGASVTGATAGRSYHQYGLAADCAFFRAGKLVITEKDPWAARGYQLYGELAREYGLTWGGGWRLKDYGHVELRGSRYDDPSKRR